MITEIDLSQYYIKKEEIKSAFGIEEQENVDAATVISDAVNAKPDLGTSHNDAARGDHNHDEVYLKSYTPPTASTTNAGIVQLNTSTNDSSVSQAATPSAVKAAYQLAANKTITVEKLSTATNGYLATYEIKQGGTLLEKIEIPKDFLIESGSVKTCETADTPEQGYKKGDKYIDFIINAKNGGGSESHIFVNLRDLIDIYKADEETIHLISDSTGNKFEIKENGIDSSHIKDGAVKTRHIDNNIQIDFDNLNISKEDIVGLGIPESDTDTHYYADNQTIQLGNDNKFKVKDEVFAEKNHQHGSITNAGTIGTTQNLPLITGENGKIKTGSFGTSDNTFSEGSHQHGNILNNGTLNNDTQTVSKVVVTDSTTNLRTITKLPFANLTIPDSNTGTKGLVQLYNSIDNSSATLAATANAVKMAYDKGNHSHPYISTNAGSVGTANLANNSVSNEKLRPTSIPDGTDLSTLTTPGFYYSNNNADTLKHVPKAPDLDGLYDEPLGFTLVVEGAPDGPYTQTLTYQSDYSDKLITTQFTRTCRHIAFGWSGWVLSACSRPIEIYSSDNFYLIVNPVGRTATLRIYSPSRNFGNTLVDGSIIRYFKRDGSITTTNTAVIPTAYRPHINVILNFFEWSKKLIGRVMTDGGVRIGTQVKGEHTIRATATWVY